jgi:predicted ATPase
MRNNLNNEGDLLMEFKEIALKHESNFVINETNEKAYRLLLLYFMNDPRFEQEVLPNTGKKGSLKKGIYLVGDTGSGKSFMLKDVIKSLTTKYRMNSYQIHKYSKIMRDYECEGSKILESFGPIKTSFGGIIREETKVIYIDDFLSTGSEINRFGNTINFADQLIDLRYDAFEQDGKKTHFSANFYPQKMSEFLDERSTSRLSQMCNFIELTGEDWRRK